MSQKILFSTDESLIDLGVDIYGDLVGLGGVNIAQHIEEKVNYCINSLYKQDKADKKYAMLSMLVELLRHSQFTTFNKIRKYSKYTELFRAIIAEKKLNYKKRGLELIDECIKEIGKRDIQEQTNMLNNIYTDIFKDRQPKSLDSEVNFGVAVVLKSLLTYAHKNVLKDRFKEICDFINALKGSKQLLNQHIVIEIFPILSAYNPEDFLEKRYLDQAIAHLLKILSNNQTPQLKKLCYYSLSRILDPYHAEKINSKVGDILGQLFAEFKAGEKVNEAFLLQSMVAVSEKVQKFFVKHFTEEQIHELVNRLLTNGITEEVLNYLEFLLKINLPDLNSVIQIKLLYTISYVLMNGFYSFTLTNKIADRYRQSVEEFKGLLDKSLKSIIKEDNNETLICASLNCLSRFKFTDFNDQMVSSF